MEELSLLSLYKKLADQQTTYSNKIDYLYSIFNEISTFPKEVSNSNDSPGLWPDNGIHAYTIVSSYNLAQAFCTEGVIVNIASQRYKFQLMMVNSDELNDKKVGHLFYRQSKLNFSEWTKWEKLLDQSDIDDLINGNTVVKKAMIATKLETPRNIALSGIISGNIDFDGSQDVIMTTNSANVVPLNIKLEAKLYPYESYILLCTLPVSVSSTYDYVIIDGHIGGWTKNQGKAKVTMCVSNRDGILVNGTILGTLNSCDILVYKSLDLTAQIYLKINANSYVDDGQLSIYGSSQIKINNEKDVVPKGTLTWTLSNDGISFNGKQVSGNVSGTATSATYADTAGKVQTENQNNTKAYITASTGSGTKLIYDTNVTLDQSSGAISATTFNGNLSGNANSSTSSIYTQNVRAINDNEKKVYVVGVESSNTTPYYDQGIYITSQNGQMHGDKIDAGELTSDTSIVQSDAHVYGNLFGYNIMHSYKAVQFHNNDSISALTMPNTTLLQCSSEFSASKIYNAIWNDYAEYFPRGGDTEPGDVIVLDTEADNEQYIKSYSGAKLVVGVHSNEFGHIIGGETPPENESFESYNIKKYIPVALAGRVKTKFIGKSIKGGKIVCANNGCARLYDNLTDDISDVFGYLLESDDKTEQRLLKIKIK